MSMPLSTDLNNNRRADHEIDAMYLQRWSPRSFLSKEVPTETLLTVLEAARWAPSGGNLQPWRYIIARTPEDRARFLSFIAPSNQVWCEQAPVLALVLSHTLTAGGNLNRSHSFDAGTSWGYLALEAAKQGLITHAMGGFNPDQARIALQVPEEFEINAVIAIGYQGPADALPDKLQEREIPSSRRPLTESLFEGSFGASFHSAL